MLRAVITVACFAAFCFPAFAANDVVGTWQGKAANQHILKVTRNHGKLAAVYFNPNTGDPSEHPVSSISFNGAHLHFTIDLGCVTDRPDSECTYDGDMAADGKSILGTWQTIGKPVTMTLDRATRETEGATDSTPHKIQFVTVEKGVKLEVLDWGGSGPPLIFLHGLNATAHVFDIDGFATKFANRYHVYGITRRGYGASSMPDPSVADYSSDRLGDDVIAVMDALKLQRPVLVGWSAAGMEMSSVASRFPDRVAGLVYLDAGNTYAFYRPGFDGVPTGTNLAIDANEFNALMAQYEMTFRFDKARAIGIVQEMKKRLADYEKDMDGSLKAMAVQDQNAVLQANTLQIRVGEAIMHGARRYGPLKPPILAIYAVPKSQPPNATPEMRARMTSTDDSWVAQADAFAAAMPNARVVKIPNSQHAVWLSNPAEVTKEMDDFLAKLPKQ